MPETFLNAIGSWPVRAGTTELTAELKRLKDMYDVSDPWTSIPMSVQGEALRGKNPQGIANVLTGALGEAAGDITQQGGTHFRKAPFLWSQVNVPVTDATARMPGMLPSWLSHELSDYPAGVPLPDKIRMRKRVPFLYGNAFNPMASEMRFADVSPKQVFHEFGHARDLGRPWRRNMVVGADALGKTLKYTVPASILFRDAISDYVPGSVDDKVVDALQAYGPEAWLASKVVSDLHPELVATRHAGKKIKALEGVLDPSFLKKQLRANKLGMASRIPRVAIPYALMALARSAMKNEVKKKDGLEKESAVPLPAALESIWRGGKTLLQRGQPVKESLQHVFAPFGAPTPAALKAMFSNPLLKDSLLGVGVPVGVSGLTLAALNAKKEKADAARKAEELGEYEEIAETSKFPLLSVALRAGGKVGKDALSTLGVESLGELLS